jgi:hypothetical protein
MKLRGILDIVFWLAVVFLAIRYAHWILAGFASLFLVATVFVLAGYVYLRHLWKKTEKRMADLAAETAEMESAMHIPKQSDHITADGPIIHIQAETIQTDP